MCADLKKFYDEADKLADDGFIKKRLGTAISHQSVPSEAENRPNVVATEKFLEEDLGKFGANVEPFRMGKQQKNKPTDPDLDLPPILVACIRNDKKTLLIYGHYDVQPELTGWSLEHPAFKLTKGQGLSGEQLYGLGSTDDKGPILGWLNVIEAHKKAGVEIPVNLIFCFEGMEESSVAEGVIADNFWITTKHPCLTYGLRGINYFRVTITGSPKQLHSGIYGGAIVETMTDLFSLFPKLVDNKGKILIPGINDQVEELTEKEQELYKKIRFALKDFTNAIGDTRVPLYENPTDIIMHRWRYPSLSIHGINGADPSDDSGTTILNKVTGAFSIRTVPRMDSDTVNKKVTDYRQEEFKKLGSKCEISIELSPETTSYWWTETEDPNFEAAAKATKAVYKTNPDYTREGGSNGVALYLQTILGEKRLLLLSVGASDDGPHGPNEKIDRRNYIEGTKLFGAYRHYFADKT
ncbi:putative glutamate carboxypeptidase [Aspergillus ruber CBS 135680]|uniref:Putative glutamate carboxypeptidase n=1 Tax=Aspergillus ruber (strain CBS 135680) TaxID=1388766 RepID=A0A017SMD7_ASPRC|nr:putative glutamate carboxypeptidase [Aspergillus ruber CBS 135680]EYE98087.1 putative glutamate carboxypeptidase [Aspergillus ruber CBS 135680]